MAAALLVGVYLWFGRDQGSAWDTDGLSNWARDVNSIHSAEHFRGPLTLIHVEYINGELIGDFAYKSANPKHGKYVEGVLHLMSGFGRE
jgi:hypothetical protein